jgi:hypothetical protein
MACDERKNSLDENRSSSSLIITSTLSSIIRVAICVAENASPPELECWLIVSLPIKLQTDV